MIAEVWLWTSAEEIEQAERLGINEPEKQFDWSPCYIDAKEITVVWLNAKEDFCITLKSGENYTIRNTKKVTEILRNLEKLPW